MHLQTNCIKPFCIISKFIQTEIIHTTCINPTCIIFKFIQTKIIHTPYINSTCIFFRFIQTKIIHIFLQAPAQETKLGFSSAFLGQKEKSGNGKAWPEISHLVPAPKHRYKPNHQEISEGKKIALDQWPQGPDWGIAPTRQCKLLKIFWRI